MDSLRVFLFGRFHVQGDESNLKGFDGIKVQELFSYLLIHRDYPHPREVLSNLLWNDCLTSQSKGYLRKTLWQLQAALEGSPICLVVEADYIQLNTQVDLALDVATFEQAFHRCQGVIGRELLPSQAQMLQEAVQLYKGCFLEGWYQEWCLFERERLYQMYLLMLDKLMDYCEAYAAYEEGLLYGHNILRYDQARERTHRSLMRLYYLAANRTEALRQYERCVNILETELGVKPSKQTVFLYEQIRNDWPGEIGETAVSPSAPSLLDLNQSLQQCQTALNEMQHHVWQMNAAMQTLLGEQPTRSSSS